MLRRASILLVPLALALVLPAVGAQESVAMLHAMDDGTGGGYTYDPTSLVVAPGAEIVVMAMGGEPHTVTPDEAGAFADTRVEAGDASGRTTFRAPSEPGDYGFHCKFHPEMQGVLTVAVAGAPPTGATAGSSQSGEGAQTPFVGLLGLLGLVALVALASRRAV